MTATPEGRKRRTHSLKRRSWPRSAPVGSPLKAIFSPGLRRGRGGGGGGWRRGGGVGGAGAWGRAGGLAAALWQRPMRAAVDLPLLVDHVERGFRGAHGLGLAQEQKAARLVQRIGEHIEHVLLQFGLEIDEHVAADHQVDARER